MRKRKVTYDDDVRTALQRALPHRRFGAGAILKGLSTEQVLRGYCIAYDEDWENKEYCTFKYIVYNGNVYLMSGEE